MVTVLLLRSAENCIHLLTRDPMDPILDVGPAQGRLTD